MESLTVSKEEMSFYQKQVDDMLIWDEKNRRRNYDNQRFYWGIDYGQWPDDVVAQHIKWKRQITTLNIARQKVNGLAGSLLTNKYNIDFVPIDGKMTELTNMLKDLMQADYELLDWRASEKQCVIDSLIYEGIEEMFISDKYDPLGNIGFRAIMSGLVTWDPRWKTYSPMDCRKYAKIMYMGAEQIKQAYGKDSGYLGQQLDNQVDVEKRNGPVYGANLGVTGLEAMSPRDGNQYRVIEFYELKEEIEEYEIDTATDIELPKTDDVALKMEWLNKMVPDRDPGRLMDDVQVKERKDLKLYVKAFCPSLNGQEFLSNGLHEIQIKRPHLFPLSAARMNGEKSGMIDLIKDPQRMINYKESLSTYAMQTAASGGLVVDTAIFGGDDNLKKEFKARKSDPSYILMTAPGMLAKNPNAIQAITKGQMPYNEIQTEINRMLDMVDRISAQPAAADARTQSANESGVLFAQKAKMGEIGQYVLMENVRQHVNDKGEGYFYQAQNTYGNGDTKREFTVFSKKKTVVINEKINLIGGTSLLKNRIKTIPRHKVIVTESPQGETRRISTVMMATDLLQKLDPNANPITRQIFTQKIVKNIDVFDEEDKKKLEEAGELEYELAKMNVQTQIANMSAAQAQAAQASQPQAQMELAQGGESSVSLEGSVPPPEQVSTPPTPQEAGMGGPQ